jgi:hypothetical protein
VTFWEPGMSGCPNMDCFTKSTNAQARLFGLPALHPSAVPPLAAPPRAATSVDAGETSAPNANSATFSSLTKRSIVSTFQGWGQLLLALPLASVRDASADKYPGELRTSAAAWLDTMNTLLCKQNDLKYM